MLKERRLTKLVFRLTYESSLRVERVGLMKINVVNFIYH